MKHQMYIKLCLKLAESSGRNIQYASDCLWEQSCVSYISSNDLQDKERGMRATKVTGIVGSHQLLKIQRQLTNFVCWWTEAIKFCVLVDRGHQIFVRWWTEAIKFLCAGGQRPSNFVCWWTEAIKFCVLVDRGHQIFVCWWTEAIKFLCAGGQRSSNFCLLVDRGHQILCAGGQRPSNYPKFDGQLIAH